VPVGYANCLLIGDQGALPAIARWLESLTPGATAQAIIAVQDRAAEVGKTSTTTPRLTLRDARSPAAGLPSSAVGRP
jgi:NADPH-dependent ferric siderophore reductase